jgi:uncharacterized iron-regulated protein
MKKLIIAPAIFVLMSFTLLTGSKDAYVLYDSQGKRTDYNAMLAEAKKADVILFGELHDNPMCHWLQRELTQDLHSEFKDKLVLGAEMFEADDQVALNEYLAGKISDKTLKEEVKLWNNYATDYKPLVDIAKRNKLKFVAANIPRRYANLVYSRGLSALDSISPEAKKWIAPLPMKYDSTLKCYKEIFENAGGHGGQNLPKSQAIKDATMAHFILQNWKKGQLFVHYNGAYHSNHHQGIEWYLKQQMPALKVMVIASTEQNDTGALEDEAKGSGDFIICTPASLTKTYK